ncbi:MAG: hypothetical protein HY692_02315, partial [Cyanobacteria bacterium NC_groundwater_1444_Ag_S-0.65um_54_12]|nr:hypothetical protein [Cyanobacteria bacterium NC_groundwater_1444_Ag_S-0.65um_54_12]
SIPANAYSAPFTLQQPGGAVQLIGFVNLQGTVGTLAGSGASGYRDGPGNLALFAAPKGVAVDADGNVYVADRWNLRVRKITPDGTVSTLASSSLLRGLSGIAADSDGSVVITTSDNSTFPENNKVWRVSPTGQITAIAGDTGGAAGSADGVGNAARFNEPYEVAIDSQRNIYVADMTGCRIRKILPDGTVSTLAGNGVPDLVDGSGLAASFRYPYGLVADASGDVYVADRGNSCIRKVSPGGAVTTLAGTNVQGYVDGDGSNARFSSPYGITLASDGNLYVADPGIERIRRVTLNGTVTTVAGSGISNTVDGSLAIAEFAGVRAIAADSRGHLYVGDWGEANRIRVVTP